MFGLLSGTLWGGLAYLVGYFVFGMVFFYLVLELGWTHCRILYVLPEIKRRRVQMIEGISGKIGFGIKHFRSNVMFVASRKSSF